MINLYLQEMGVAFLISLTGSLPLGNLNLMALRISASENLQKALWFSLGVTIVEMLYLRVTLAALLGIAGNDRLFVYCRIVSVLFLLALSVGSFVGGGAKERKNVFVENKMNRFGLGLVMSALNPMQIPFWAGWVLVLGVGLHASGGALLGHLFILGAGLGTFVALLLFVWAGARFAPLMKLHERKVNIAMGIVFLVLAIFQVSQLVSTF